MRRRDTLAALLAFGMWPLRGRAQAAPRARAARIGLFVPSVHVEGARRQFVAEMRKHGWAERRDFVIIDLSASTGAFEVERAATRAIGEMPDLFFVQGTSRALAIHRRTATTPIVMWTSGYPVEAGLAESLGRPGKNVTGNSLYAGTGIWGKMVQLLREAAPAIRRVGVLWGYSPPAFLREEIGPPQVELREAARALGVETIVTEYQSPDAAPQALELLLKAQADALMLVGRAPLGTRHQSVLQVAEQHRLPTIADSRWPPFEGRNPLLAFGASWDELMRPAVAYVVRILQGTPAGDLPIQQPTRFNLVVNLKTAKALGLKVPQSILVRADEVIE